MNNPSLKIIRAKKLGVLIRDARVKLGKSVQDCAQAVGVPAEEQAAMEFGERPPTLPELEILAYYLAVPLSHFWGNELLKTNGSEKSIDAAEIKQLRQDGIGGLLRKARIEAVLSIDELAQKTGIAAENIQSLEQGEVPIALPELENLLLVLNKSITDFEDQQSPVGSWFVEQRNLEELLDLPKDLQEFVGKAINRPYLELAVRLSELKVEKLRALAEGLLEITL
jgi:transcriptional regulator with XRE-family HTH domain